MIGKSPYLRATSSSDLGLEPLLPERRPLAGTGPRDQQRAGGVLAEAGAEQRRRAQLADDQVLELVGLEQDQLAAPGRLLGVGEVDDDPVVGPDRVGLEPELLTDPRAEREPPGSVHAAPVRGQDAQTPVADLVPEALEDDRPIARDHPGGVLLLAQELDQVAGRARSRS